MKKTLYTLYCIECGSTDVSSQAWVNEETNTIEEYVGTRYDEEFNYCNRCESRTKLVTIEELWELFADISINDDDEIESDFLCFKAGTSRFDVWHWFDERCPNGLAIDLMGETPKDDAVQK